MHNGDVRTTTPSESNGNGVRQVLGKWAREPKIYLTKRIKRILYVKKHGHRGKGASGKADVEMLRAAQLETKKQVNRAKRKMSNNSKRVNQAQRRV